MREFARLFAELDETTATNRKLDALQAYFSSAAPENAAWAVYFLAGGKPRQAVPTKLLRQYAIEYAQLDDWLFEESYQAVGDLAETIAHILPPPERQSDIGLAEWMQERIGPLRGADPAAIRAALFALLERTRHARTLPADQTDRRRLPRRRLEAAGHARAVSASPRSTAS